MAVVNLTPIQAKFNDITIGTMTAGHVDGVTYDLADRDERLILIAQNSDAAVAYDLTIKAPTNKTFTSAKTDVVKELKAGEVAAVPVESAKYVDASTGKITFDVENAAIQFVLVRIV